MIMVRQKYIGIVILNWVIRVVDNIHMLMSLQVTRGDDKTKKKCVYVVHSEDSKDWVMKTLQPILGELNTDMLTSEDLVPGKTIAQARLDSTKEAQIVMVVFSKLTIAKGRPSEEQKWFNYELSQAVHKDPDPLNITVIPILLEAISSDQLPESMKNIVPLKINDPQFKHKIQKVFSMTSS